MLIFSLTMGGTWQSEVMHRGYMRAPYPQQWNTQVPFVNILYDLSMPSALTTT